MELIPQSGDVWKDVDGLFHIMKTYKTRIAYWFIDSNDNLNASCTLSLDDFFDRDAYEPELVERDGKPYVPALKEDTYYKFETPTSFSSIGYHRKGLMHYMVLEFGEAITRNFLIDSNEATNFVEVEL